MTKDSWKLGAQEVKKKRRVAKPVAYNGSDTLCKPIQIPHEQQAQISQSVHRFLNSY